jgi:hypothetical protein
MLLDLSLNLLSVSCLLLLNNSLLCKRDINVILLYYLYKTSSYKYIISSLKSVNSYLEL